MTSWEDVACKGLDFLMKPTGLGVVVVFGLFLLAAYLTPTAVLAWSFSDNTSRIERAIYAMGQSLNHTVATRPK